MSEPTKAPATVEFAEVLKAELDAIVVRREAVFDVAGKPTKSAGPPPSATASETEPPPNPSEDGRKAAALPEVGPTPNAGGESHKLDESATNPEVPPPAVLEDQRERALDLGTVGLAFSGGGIRSATFNLGFLQGVASLKLLRSFDYLSTVSGGGYIGSFLAAWIRRETPTPGGTQVENVERQLTPNRVVQKDAVRQIAVPLSDAEPDKSRPEPLEQVIDDEPEPISHLRAHSRYLAPDASPLGLDRWTLVAIYLRNTLVNLTIVFAAAVALVAFSRLIVWLFARGPDSKVLGRQIEWTWVPTLVFLGAGGRALYLLIQSHLRLHRADRPSARRLPSPHWITRGLVLAAVLGAWLFSPQIGDGPSALRHALYQRLNTALKSWFGVSDLATVVVYGVVFGVAFGGIAALALWRGRLRGGRLVGGVFKYVGFGCCVGLALIAALAVLWTQCTHPVQQAAFGPPLLLAAVIFGGYLELVLFGSGLTEYEREWRSRIGAHQFRAALAWVAFFGITLYLPWAVHAYWEGIGGYLGSAAVLGWVGTTALSVLAGKSSKTAGEAGGPNRILEWLALVGPVVFLVGFLALVSALLPPVFTAVARSPVAAACEAVGLPHTADPIGPAESGVGRPPAAEKPNPAPDAVEPSGGSNFLDVAADTSGSLVLVVLVAAVGLTIGLGWRVDANVFSLHALYGNRLVRSYLGASRRKPRWKDRARGGRADRVNGKWRWGSGVGGAPTGAEVGQLDGRDDGGAGFDPKDDLDLKELRIEKGVYDGPFLIVNTSLCLVGGTELEKQDRKADAFFLTPLFCGGERTGYVEGPTGEYAKNLTLGRALTISGAAVDPNMGFHAVALQAFLLTVFNARLGWWFRNPRFATKAEGWRAEGPRGEYVPRLLKELVGGTTADSPYVHLTDGGHFENSGVYELVRRRCRFVVCCDAAEDAADASENLANLIRLIKEDFGIRIEIDTAPLKPDETGLSRWHVAVGTIKYDDVDERGVAGTFVFVRSVLTGDEPPDVRQYAATHPAFPHDPTVTDQFFDAGQFEAYRELGYHTARTVFEEPAARDRDWPPPRSLSADAYAIQIRQLFARVRNRWYPPPPDFGALYTEAAARCDKFLSDVRTDDRLKHFTRDLYPELRVWKGASKDDEQERREVLAVNQALNVLELAWLGIELDSHYAHPMNRGWVNAFRRWTTTETFQRYWPVLRAEYSKDFVRFCERALNLPAALPRLFRAPPGFDPKAPPPETPEPAAVGWFRTALADLGREFGREWGEELGRLAAGPNKPPVHKAWLAEVVGEVAADREPLLWVLAAAAGDVPPPADPLLPGVPPEEADYPIGVVAVYPVKPPAEKEGEAWYEVFFWIRGAYRSLGHGRTVAVHLVRDQPGAGGRVGNALREHNKGKKIRVQARFPNYVEGEADRLQRTLWATFFYDFDFRRGPRPPAGHKQDFLVLFRYLPEGPAAGV